MDTVTKEKRSEIMSKIRSKNTKIEVKFRKLLWNNGYRNYRVKNKIKGKPDMYFPAKKIAVFIDGCFWHKCPKCYVEPKSNRKYWVPKIERNVTRDKKINKELKKQKIKVFRIWEHYIRKDLPQGLLVFKKTYNQKIK